MNTTIEKVAAKLANAHRSADHKTTTIKYFPNTDEIYLLEVSASAPTTNEILPFRFGEDTANGVYFPSTVILVSPDEWTEVANGTLTLPQGWDLAKAVDL